MAGQCYQNGPGGSRARHAALWGARLGVYGGCGGEAGRTHVRRHRLGRPSGAETRLMGFGHRVYKNYDTRAQISGMCSSRLADREIGRTQGL
jgi:hypothetical protein